MKGYLSKTEGEPIMIMAEIIMECVSYRKMKMSVCDKKAWFFSKNLVEKKEISGQ